MLGLRLLGGAAASALGDMMNLQEHVSTARAFLKDSDKEFMVGDRLQGCEKLWGAASHAVMAAAENNGWSDGSHRALKMAVGHLADAHGDPSLSPNPPKR